jgi:hypothetical protein
MFFVEGRGGIVGWIVRILISGVAHRADFLCEDSERE